MKLIDLNNVKLGDKYFGIVNKYSYSFWKGIKIVEFEVIKINLKSIKIAWDNESRKNPQLVMKRKIEAYYKTKLECANEYLKNLNINFPRNHKYLRERIVKYCKRIIKIESVTNPSDESKETNKQR